MILKQVVIQVASALHALSTKNIVHADLKPDNICIKFDNEKTNVNNVMLVDFGSSFIFDKNHVDINTDSIEYCAPEVLTYLQRVKSDPRNKVEYAKLLFESGNQWSIDVWSFGIIILEMVYGYPVWMKTKGKIEALNGKSSIRQGIFTERNPDRDIHKIKNTQKKFEKELLLNLKKNDNYGIMKIPELASLVERMLVLDPRKRISPKEILEHNFCKNI